MFVDQQHVIEVFQFLCCFIHIVQSRNIDIFVKYFHTILLRLSFIAVSRKMCRYWRAAVLFTVMLTGVLMLTAGLMETLTEEDLKAVVAKTQFVLVLYCKYWNEFNVF